MAKLKTQFNDLVQAPEVVFFENTITITKDFNNNQTIDLTQYDNYKVIIDANGTTYGGSVAYTLPSKIYIEIINLATIDGGSFEVDGAIVVNAGIDSVYTSSVYLDVCALPIVESTDVYIFFEKIGKINNLVILGQ